MAIPIVPMLSSLIIRTIEDKNGESWYNSHNQRGRDESAINLNDALQRGTGTGVRGDQTSVDASKEGLSDVGTYPSFGSGGNFFDNLISYLFRTSLTGAEREQNQFNADQAEINRDWQEEMQNTSFQRQVADMRAAGLNPALMYGNVSQPSTPSGATASGSTSLGSGLNLGQLLSFALGKSQLRLDADMRGKDIQLRNRELDQNAYHLESERIQAVANSRNANAEAEGREIDNLWHGDISNANLELLKKNANKVASEINLLNEQAKSEVVKRYLDSMQAQYYQAAANQSNAKAREIAELLPLQKAVMDAQEDDLKQSTAMKYFQTLYEKHMVSPDMIDALEDEAAANAQDAQERAEIHAAYNRLRKGEAFKPSMAKTSGGKVIRYIGGYSLAAITNVGDAVGSVFGMSVGIKK